MKRFVGILAILVAICMVSPAIADDMRTFTVELYDASNDYVAETATSGGVLTAASGTSTWTWTAKGQFTNMTDHRTIDLGEYAPTVGSITFQLLNHPDAWDGGSGPDSGVSFYGNPLDAGALAVGVAFSEIDSADAWSGASTYWFWNYALSGNTPVPLEINHDDTDVVFGRYMRAFFTGASPFYCPQGTFGVHPK